MKHIGFKLKEESKAIKTCRIIFYITAACYFVYDLFFSLGFYLFKAEFAVYTIPMLIFCACVLLGIIFVKLRLYITSAILMSVSCIGNICIGFMLRNPSVFSNGLTHNAISKEMFMFNFLPVIIPTIAVFVLLFPSLSARRAQRIDEETTYTPQFK